MSKKDHLWIKWVAAIYLKGRSWLDYEPSPNSSWAWRQICKVKSMLKSGYVNGKWRGTLTEYTIADGYRWLTTEQDIKVTWFNCVWNRYVIPKHSFIGWLAMQERLLTQDRLARMGVTTAGICYLCAQGMETHQHLFADCPYTQKCFAQLTEWLNITWTFPDTWKHILNDRKMTVFARQVVCAILMATYYGIWHNRNTCRVQGAVITPARLITLIKADIRLRISIVYAGRLSSRNLEWGGRIGIV